MEWYWFVIIFLVGLLSPGPSDPTDKNFWKRSGLYYYKDHGTGCEYLSAGGGMFGKGALTPRLDANGNHICSNESHQHASSKESK